MYYVANNSKSINFSNNKKKSISFKITSLFKYHRCRNNDAYNIYHCYLEEKNQIFLKSPSFCRNVTCYVNAYEEIYCEQILKFIKALQWKIKWSLWKNYSSVLVAFPVAERIHYLNWKRSCGRFEPRSYS